MTKKNDLLEAEVSDLKSQVHRLINEKLALLSGTPRETNENNGQAIEEKEEPVRQAAVPKGQTL